MSTALRERHRMSTGAPRVPATTTLPSTDLRHAFRLLEHAQRHLRTSVAAGVGVTVSELTALEAVAEMPGMTPTMLSLDLAFTTGAVTALLDRLAAVDYLARVPNPKDRRSVHLRLTPCGEAVLAGATARYDEVSAAVAGASAVLAAEDMAEELTLAAAIITAYTLG